MTSAAGGPTGSGRSSAGAAGSPRSRACASTSTAWSGSWRAPGPWPRAADGGDRLVVAVATRPRAGRRRGRAPLALRRARPARRRRVAVVVRADLPRLPSGKVDARALAALAPADGAGPALESTAADDIAALYARLLGRAAAADDRHVRLPRRRLPVLRRGVAAPRAAARPAAPGLADTARRASSPPPAARRRRAAPASRPTSCCAPSAIVSIVGSHANLFTLLGGAHLLLAVAGFNFAPLPARGRRPGASGSGTCCAASPASPCPRSLVIGAGRGCGPTASAWRQALLLNGLTTRQLDRAAGTTGSSRRSSTWSCSLAALAACRPSTGWSGRTRSGCPSAWRVGARCVTRYGLVGVPGDNVHRAHVVFWLFALGWAAARPRADATGCCCR